MRGESSSWDGTEISGYSKEFQVQNCYTVPTPTSGGMPSLLDIKKMVNILKSVCLSARGIRNFSFPSSSVWTVKWPLCQNSLDPDVSNIEDVENGPTPGLAAAKQSKHDFSAARRTCYTLSWLCWTTFVHISILITLIWQQLQIGLHAENIGENA